jgi:hypothetical protein
MTEGEGIGMKVEGEGRDPASKNSPGLKSEAVAPVVPKRGWASPATVFGKGSHFNQSAATSWDSWDRL